MYRVFTVILVFTAVIGSVLSFYMDEEWAAYKSTYNKNYAGQEDLERRLIWESHLKLINRHNMAADRGEHSYWLGMNKYGDLSNGEFVRLMNGMRVTNETKTRPSHIFTSTHVTLPKHVDWREEGYVTEVKDQKQCGGCWSFSGTGALEGQHFKKTGQLVSLSEQNLMDCSWSYGNNGCAGGVVQYAYEYIRDNNGVDTEASYPYEARDATCRFKRENVGATCTGYVDIPRGDEQTLEEAVGTVGPVSVAIDASHTSFQLYKRGIYDEKECSSTFLDHAVLAVGYGVEEGSDYWIVKNSWGTSWGNKGYILMSRNKNNQCGIATQACYPLV